MKPFKSIITILTAPMAVLVVGLLLLGTGCGNKAPQLSTAESNAFDSAPAEVKEMWQKALAADKANDYITAVSLLDNLNQMTLSDPQRKALEVERNAFGQRLMTAVNNNNPEALKAAQNSEHPRNNASKANGK